MPPPKVFICYARSDNESGDAKERWLDRVRRHLHPFEQQGDFEVFCDEVVDLGENWHERIQTQLGEARVALLLVSAAFLASRYIASSEIPILLQRARTEGVRIIPIIVSPCAFGAIQFRYPDPRTGPERRKLSSLQSAGTPQESLCEVPYGRQERILAEVAETVAQYALAPPEKTPAASGKPPPEDESDRLIDRVPSPSVPPPTAVSDREWTNSLGMRFVPVGGTEVRFCIWPTRVQDYEAFAAANPGADASWKDPMYEGVPVTPGPTHPVVNVSWEDAKRFCEWLTETEQKARRLLRTQYYRLPTDLEWSAAVGLSGEPRASPADRNGNPPGVYPWGRQWPPPHGSGNFADESLQLKFSQFTTIEGYRDGYATTSPVGEFKASKDGLFDLAGNVWEWCEDWFNSEKNHRVLRGGSWFGSGPAGLLSSCRRDRDPGTCNYDSGFRLVLVGAGSAR